jgi:hypothetical protein
MACLIGGKARLCSLYPGRQRLRYCIVNASALLRDDPLDALQRRIGAVMCLECFPRRAEPILQSGCGLSSQITQKLRSHITSLGEGLPAGEHGRAGIAFAADIEGEV